MKTTSEYTEYESKMEALAQKVGVDKLRALVPAKKVQIEQALAGGDIHLSSIPLALWDKAAGGVARYSFQLPEVFRECGSTSLSERVSVLKHVAKFHMDEPVKVIPEPVPFVRSEPVDYQAQAEGFLSRFGLKFRATLSDSKAPAWADGERHGHHYRVTLSRPSDAEALYVEPVDGFPQPKRPHRLVFDFWGSIADADKLKDAAKSLQNLQLQRQNCDQWSKGTFDLNFGEEMKARERAVAECHPSAYDVLACISSDAYCPETFEDFCGDYGCETDSIKALQTFRRCSAFAKRLRAFFTAEELEALSEIQ